jgi:hypothetical protein
VCQIPLRFRIACHDTQFGGPDGHMIAIARENLGTDVQRMLQVRYHIQISNLYMNSVISDFHEKKKEHSEWLKIW